MAWYGQVCLQQPGTVNNGKKPLLEGEEEYLVDEIQASKKQWNKIVYLVYWSSIDSEEDTLEPLFNLKHAMELVEEFHLKDPSTP